MLGTSARPCVGARVGGARNTLEVAGGRGEAPEVSPIIVESNEDLPKISKTNIFMIFYPDGGCSLAWPLPRGWLEAGSASGR